VWQDLPGIDLGKSCLDFADKPVVVVHRPLEGLAREHLNRHAPATGRDCELVLQLRREAQFHALSVQTDPGDNNVRL